jgi:hypothetical protein
MHSHKHGPSPGGDRQLPHQPAQGVDAAAGYSMRESFSEPRSWAVKWCGYGLFNPNRSEAQTLRHAGEC